MADKILPQRVSAFHSSPRRTPHPALLRPPLPLPRSPPLPPQEQSFSVTVTFTFCSKSQLRSEASQARGGGGEEGSSPAILAWGAVDRISATRRHTEQGRGWGVGRARLRHQLE